MVGKLCGSRLVKVNKELVDAGAAKDSCQYTCIFFAKRAQCIVGVEEEGALGTLNNKKHKLRK